MDDPTRNSRDDHAAQNEEADATRTAHGVDSAPTSALPRSIGGYRVLGKLGEGEMGTVYEAQQESPRRKVALKVVRGGQFVDEQRIRMFQREADTLARLKHPNIGGIYETGRTGRARPICSAVWPSAAGGSARNRVRLPDRMLDVQALHRHFPAVSPDGREIVSTVWGRAEDPEGARAVRLVVAPVDGGEGRDVFQPGQDYDPSFYLLGSSWAGDWITFGSGPAFAPAAAVVDIWKVRSDGSEAVNLTAGSDANNAWPDFSSDGERIVFRSGRDGNFEIYVMDADGRNVRRLTNDPGLDTMPAFSPKGNQIAFSSNRDGEYPHADFDIYLLDLTAEGEPGQLRRLTHSFGPDMHVHFSPDGEWIAFTSHRGGLNDELDLSFTDAGQPYGEIYAQRLSDGLVVRLTHNKWEDGPVAWGKSPASTAVPESK